MGERERQIAELEREVAEQAREDARKAAAEAIAARFHWFEVRQWALYVLFFFALAFSAWHASEQRDAIKNEARRTDAAIQRARDVRGRQLCEMFARDHLRAIRQRDRSIAYLRELAGDDRSSAINVAIRRNLPMLEEEVRTTVPPAFCRTL